MPRALDFAPGRNTQRGAWVGDFRLENGYVHVKSTGVRFKNDWQLWSDIGRWFTYYAFVRVRGRLSRCSQCSEPSHATKASSQGAQRRSKPRNIHAIRANISLELRSRPSVQTVSVVSSVGNSGSMRWLGWPTQCCPAESDRGEHFPLAVHRDFQVWLT